MESDRRKFARSPTSIRVEMQHPSFGTLVGFARDISDGGAQVLLEGEVIPPVGTVVRVMFRKIAGAVNAEPVAMQVVHQTRNIVGLMFAPGPRLG